MSTAFEWGEFSAKALHSIQTSDARINLWHGAVRSSKTVSSEVRWLKFIHQAPKKGHLLMCGVTIGTLKDNILDTLEEMVGPENYRYVAGSREVYICGRRILIRGAGDEAAERKIRGLTLAGVYGDEVTLWPQNFFKRTLDRMSVHGAKGFYTTNPDSPNHWLKTEYINREADLNMKSFHFELSDNPNLPNEYIENLKAEFTGLWYKRFIQGLWVVAEGAVYDIFDEDDHTIDSWQELPYWDSEEMPPWERIIQGVDYGTTNPTAFIAIGLWHGVWYAFAEYRHEGSGSGAMSLTDTQQSKAMREFHLRGGWTPQSTEIDPSAASLKQQLKQDGHGGRIRNADHEVLDGIRTVARGLTTGKLKIHASLKKLIAEFYTYTWDPKAQDERGEDKVIKLFDHSLDALRYAVMRALGRRTTRHLDKPTGV